MRLPSRSTWPGRTRERFGEKRRKDVFSYRITATRLSPTATYTEMFLTGYYYGYKSRLPEWNGWIDYNGTFIPYTGSNPSEVTFKGLKENLPDAPTFGDAYTISGGYDDNTFYYWGANNEWVEYQPT